MSSDVTPETRAEIDDAGRAATRRIDPGTRAMLIAVAVVAAVASLLLPWVAGAPGWEVLAGGAAGPLPRLFSVTLTVFAIVVSASALLTRLWVLAWLAAFGCGISSVNGVWAIWSQQTGAAGGPGFGLVLGVIAVVLLTFVWAGAALARS
ncbi:MULTISPECIES: hypothetical protein [unclassified Pseudonocardia]|uniref:Rv2732c family membrane protein n=1 Tax=unclassified Pseudonocardia TaxID=2619320 RepID=UPI0001FFE85B|nr:MULTISPECIES: hypothetical protein [unclassified Pseudonocardia]ALE74410.1 hypothetical protein FRP1_18055 [Pseudonocardia sp. EC080625-04]ALL77823.1 hypothetical protein AD006_25500 [Pseudonocardia sp. EC080610-09]ALL80739.1 hypothetical protein AD017_05090 [Pseudonocardia sp. EC080619-01]OLM17311.1 putative CONSERVED TRANSMEMBRANE PROTEIN [Pseudonocardia sp. Ae707_Ps1]